MSTTTTMEPGCYLDSHRGHYAIPAVITLATEHGFIIGQMERYVLDAYEEHWSDDDYPMEALIELSDDAIEWLNIGDNSGLDRPIKGQNSPPPIPEGHYWGWWEGDFGLYPIEDE